MKLHENKNALLQKGFQPIVQNTEDSGAASVEQSSIKCLCELGTTFHLSSQLLGIICLHQSHTILQKKSELCFCFLIKNMHRPDFLYVILSLIHLDDLFLHKYDINTIYCLLKHENN